MALAEYKGGGRVVAKEHLERVAGAVARGALPAERAVYDELGYEPDYYAARVARSLGAAYYDGGQYGGVPDPRSRAAHRVNGEEAARGGRGPRRG